MDSKLLTIMCFIFYGNTSIQEVNVGDSRILPCSFVKRPSSKSNQWVADTEVTQLKAWLVLRSLLGSFHEEGVRFIVEDPSPNLIQFLTNDQDDLVCEIKSYFTDDIQILWPGIQTKDNTMDFWFISTIKHTNNNFQLTTFFAYHSGELSMKETPTQLIPSQNPDTRHVKAVFMLSTQTPRIRTKLKDNVLLDCRFSIDHQALVTINWSLQKKGDQKRTILSYNGSTNMLQYYLKGIAMEEEKISKGDASLLVTNMRMEREGHYSCSVSASSLYADQDIHIDITESPTVTVNAESLLLYEGQEQKLVCDVTNYYPLDVNIEWVREQQNQKMIPVVVKHVLLSSHKYNSNGTYSLTSFFLLTAALQDDGAVFTCRVDHISLKQPIKRRVTIRVEESINWGYEVWFLIALIAALSGLLLYALWYLYTETQSRKRKPY